MTLFNRLIRPAKGLVIGCWLGLHLLRAGWRLIHERQRIWTDTPEILLRLYCQVFEHLNAKAREDMSTLRDLAVEELRTRRRATQSRVASSEP